MKYFVLCFGGQREAVCTALFQIAPSKPKRIWTLPPSLERSLEYQEVYIDLEQAIHLVLTDKVKSVQFDGEFSGEIYIGSINGPRFAGDQNEYWFGYLEGRDGSEIDGFEFLLQFDGLEFVGLFADDSPEFGNARISEETFPWDDERLIAGAVRGGNGQWHVRRS